MIPDHAARRLPALTAALVPLALCLLSGCGQSVGTITGEVKSKGKVVQFGRVSFYSDDDKHVKQSPIKDGTYTITDFPVGSVHITVEGVPPPSKSKVEVPKGLNIKGPNTPRPDEASTDVKMEYVPVAHEYSNRKQTPLTYTVTTGQQKKDLDLK